MSRKKDRERYFAQKKKDATYEGFRGHEREPKKEVKPLKCTICGYVRNVPLDTHEQSFICSRCQEQKAEMK